jgi:hypothetical protein
VHTDVYIEKGSKRVFAGAVDWPGWSRSGRDETSALEALLAYAPRYEAAVRAARVGFRPPKEISSLSVVQRLKGDATTDFGAPSATPAADRDDVDARELKRLLKLLQASWVAFDRAVKAAGRRRLRTGPRGGGRELRAIAGHVVGAETAYVRKIAGKPPHIDDDDAVSVTEEVRDAVRTSLTSAVEDGLPARGPRGGKLWTPPYFVRRTVWHALDHAWEIEDRVGPGA